MTYSIKVSLYVGTYVPTYTNVEISKTVLVNFHYTKILRVVKRFTIKTNVIK